MISWTTRQKAFSPLSMCSWPGILPGSGRMGSAHPPPAGGRPGQAGER
ncbi:MAG: hypothetical protein QG608_2480 [Actinomycetota bacterium]|nr:hypothetical protein [Actinomycetota bacterium]